MRGAELCTHIKGAPVRGSLLSDMAHESETINRVIIVIVKNVIMSLEEQRNKKS